MENAEAIAQVIRDTVAVEFGAVKEATALLHGAIRTLKESQRNVESAARSMSLIEGNKALIPGMQGVARRLADNAAYLEQQARRFEARPEPASSIKN